MTRIFTIMLIILLASCSKEEIKKESIRIKKNTPDSQMWNMEIIITERGEVTNKVKAGYVMGVNRGNSGYSSSKIDSGLVVEFYKNGKKEGTLNSIRGEIDEVKGVFTAMDSVVYVSPQGYTVYTEKLQWNRKKDRVSSDRKVTVITNENDTLTGDGFSSERNGEIFEITNARGKGFFEGGLLNGSKP